MRLPPVLQAAGIRSFTSTGLLMDEFAMAQAMMSNVDVFVAESDLERAQAAIAEAREAGKFLEEEGRQEDADEVRGKLAAIGESHANPTRPRDHMSVGENVTLGIDDDSGSEHLGGGRASSRAQKVSIEIVSTSVARSEGLALRVGELSRDIDDRGPDLFYHVDGCGPAQEGIRGESGVAPRGGTENCDRDREPRESARGKGDRSGARSSACRRSDALHGLASRPGSGSTPGRELWHGSVHDTGGTISSRSSITLIGRVSGAICSIARISRARPGSRQSGRGTHRLQ